VVITSSIMVAEVPVGTMVREEAIVRLREEVGVQTTDAVGATCQHQFYCKMGGVGVTSMKFVGSRLTLRIIRGTN
jgi:hypothetical protein